MYAQDRTGHGGQRQESQAELLGGTQDPLDAQALIPKPCPQAQLCWILGAGPAPTWSQPWARHSPLSQLKSTATKTTPGLGPACVPSKPAELVGLCWGNPAARRGRAIPQVQLSGRCWGSGCVLLCCKAGCQQAGEARISAQELAACERQGRRKQAPAGREAGMRQ